MTVSLEIPPAAIDAAAALSTTGRQNDERYRARMEAILQAAFPHLFSLFAERLTSDEGCERIARALHKIVYPGDKRSWEQIPQFKRQALLWDASKVLKLLIKSREPFSTTMPEALAQARGEVIHELLNRPSLSLSQIDWLKRAAAHAVDPLALSPPQIEVHELKDLFETLDALRTELTNREDEHAG